MSEDYQFDARMRAGFAAMGLTFNTQVEIHKKTPLAVCLFLVECSLDHMRVLCLTVDDGYDCRLFLEPQVIRCFFIEPIKQDVQKQLEHYTIEHPWLLGV